VTADLEPCIFCKRSGISGMHSHHVVPRCKRGKDTVPTCGSCGSFIHSTWSHNQLRDDFNTVEKIVSDERFQKYLSWLMKQNALTTFHTVRNNERPGGKYR